jgi:hypothetical protein
MSQTAPQNKHSFPRDRFRHWIVTLAHSLLKARAKTASKPAHRKVAPPERPGGKLIPYMGGSFTGGTHGNGRHPDKPAATKLPAIPQTQPNQLTTVLGTDSQTGAAVTLSLEELLMGLYGIGAPGTGKSTLDLNMIIDFIKHGIGLCLIEPHGDLTKNVIAAMPEERLKDVIYLDITDSASSFGLNFFECPAGADVTEVAKVASFVMHVFEKVWQVGPETPRLAQALRNITRLLIESGMSFSEIPLLLWEDGVREKLVRCVRNTQTKLFWSQYNKKVPRDRDELIASTINKCDAYLNEPLIARIVSQAASTIDFRRIMDEGKILLVNLSPQLEEASRLIGAVLIGRLLMAAFSRVDTPQDQRRPFLLYADEYQRFATSDFATLLAEARKFKIGTTISNQVLDQLDDANRATALQAGSLVVFRVSGDDSKVLARSFDATPTPEVVGEEPIRAQVADPLSHLVRHGHPHPTVQKFVSDYLLSLDAITRHMASVLGQPLRIGPVAIGQTHVTQARGFLNDALITCMRTSRADLFLDPLLLFILGAAPGTGIPWVFENHLRWNIFELHEFMGFKPSVRQFGEPAFLQNTQAVSRLAQRHAKKTVYSQSAGHNIHQTPGPSFIEMLTLLRQTLEILAKDPLLTDTGLFQPKYQLRTYSDQENLVANELSQLDNYTAKVRLLSGEHLIHTKPPPHLVSEREVEERIQAIKERLLREGVTLPAAAIEEEVRKRHELLRSRPDSDTPPPKRSNRRKNGQQNPPPSP